MEPQIWQSGHLASGGPKKVRFLGLKMAKRYIFLLFRQDKKYKKYILQKNWVKNLIPALGNGLSNLHPLI